MIIYYDIIYFMFILFY